MKLNSIINIITLCSLVPWVFIAYFNIFLFDSPGSWNILPLKTAAILIWIYPLAVLISVYSSRKTGSIFIALIPLLILFIAAYLFFVQLPVTMKKIDITQKERALNVFQSRKRDFVCGPDSYISIQGNNPLIPFDENTAYRAYYYNNKDIEKSDLVFNMIKQDGNIKIYLTPYEIGEGLDKKFASSSYADCRDESGKNLIEKYEIYTEKDMGNM